MSIAATNWAMEQKTDGPSAQSVLFVIAAARKQPDMFIERPAPAKQEVLGI